MRYGDITVGKKTEMRKLTKKYLKKFFLEEDGLKETYLEDCIAESPMHWFIYKYRSFRNFYYIKVNLAYSNKIFENDPINLKKLISIKKKINKKRLKETISLRKESIDEVKKYTKKKEDLDYLIIELKNELKLLK
jgi:hypothetical protein